MKELTLNDKRKIFVIGIITLFTLAVVIVLDQKIKNKKRIEKTVAVEGILTQNDLKWHYIH